MTPEMLRDRFSRDGYVAIDALFDADKMAELQAEVARYIQDVVPAMPDARVYYENKNDLSSLKQIQKLFEHDGYFEELMNGIIRRKAETVLEDDVIPVNMQYFNKPRRYRTGDATASGWLLLSPDPMRGGHWLAGSRRCRRGKRLHSLCQRLAPHR